MKKLLSTCINEFAESEYSNTRGKIRSEMTNKTYRSISKNLIEILSSKDINIYDYDLSGLDAMKDRQKYQERNSKWERLAIRIKKESRHLSENALKHRLDFMKHVLVRIEDEFGVKTGKKFFRYKASRGIPTVINTELFKKTVRHAKDVCASDEYTKQQQLGALTFLLCAYTSARLRDLMELRYSKNISFGNYSHPSYLTYQNRKTKSAPVTIKLPNDIVNILLSMETDSDLILRGYTDGTMRNNFKDFLMTMEDYHIDVTKTTPMANGYVKAKKVKLYEMITPHKVRATFITQMIENGIDLETVMSFSGHNNILTLSNRYAKVSDIHKESQYDIYASIFE